MNPYEVLGVDRNANDKTIKSAYRKLVRKWHPDLFQTEVEKKNAECKMQEISDAFDMLKTSEKRRIFDKENPVSANVYEYYANKQTKEKTNKNKTQYSTDIENEKQKKAVLQFLDVEYKHKNEILEMFAELATGAVNDAFSNEEYLEYLELVLEEQQDCITKIQKIVVVAKQKQISGLEAVFRQAQEVIEELTQKGNETPKTLEQAHYVEETRILTEKINELINSFPARVDSITTFNFLDKTWEFDDDSQLNSARNGYKKQVKELLKDIKWIQKTALARNIEVGLISVLDLQDSYYREKITLDECKKRVEKCMKILSLNLQGLREKFWKEECEYSKNSSGQIILKGFKSIFKTEEYRGTFICPPHISGIASGAFYWLKKVHSISISAHLVNDDDAIELPEGSLKNLIITFGTHSQSVAITKVEDKEITRKGDYICISSKYSFSGFDFVLVDAKGIYVYDDKKICELNGVTSMKELEKHACCEEWKGYQLQIHTWAQVTKKLPEPNVMMLLPVSVESAKEWIKMDKTNFEDVLLSSDEKLKSRVIRLYVALGALNGNYCHAQAEWLISKLDISKMYRSRLERFPKEKQENEDPMFSVPKSAVDLVQENMDNKDFLPYVFAFLEGYKLFKSEAKKANVELSPEFIISTAPQYIFHQKTDNSTTFVKQLLEIERNINVKIADRILGFYTMVQRQRKNAISKNIIETVDNYASSGMHYKFFDIELLQSYIAFAKDFRLKERFQKCKTYYGVEAENVFLSSNSHAIEIIDDENKRIAIVIFNLLDEGELFADIMTCENKSIEVLETIRRALMDQKNCNNLVTGTSIGMNEAPRTSRYNEWRKVIQDSSADWKQEVRWIKFEYLFKSDVLGTSYKGYRARFMVDGKQQYLDAPNPWDNPKISPRRSEKWY